MTMEAEAEDLPARDPRSRERRSDHRSPAARRAEEIANSVWVLLAARTLMIAAPVACAAFLWIGGVWASDKWQGLIDEIGAVRGEVVEVKAEIKETQKDVGEIKLNQAVGVVARDDMLRRIGRNEDSIIRLWGRMERGPQDDGAGGK